jgi:hypothetical protein
VRRRWPTFTPTGLNALLPSFRIMRRNRFSQPTREVPERRFWFRAGVDWALMVSGVKVAHRPCSRREGFVALRRT